MPKNRKLITWFIALFLLPTLACQLLGGSESASSQVSLGADADDATATQPAVVEDIEKVIEETATPEPSGPVSGSFGGTIGLKQFDSYRVNILLEFTGAKGESTGDATTDESQEVLLEVNKNPQAWRQIIKVKAEGAIEADAERETFFVNDIAYSYGFGQWIAQDGLLGRSQFSSPGLYAPLPETTACNTQPETINDVSVIHCTFTEQDKVANALEGAESIQGNVWIAEDGNYVIKYQLDARSLKLKGLFSGFTEFATYKINYDLLDINDVTVELPAEAQGIQPIANPDAQGESGLAAPEGAQIFVDSFASLNYFSTADLNSIVDFHRQSLPAAGWQEIPEEGYVDEGYALLIFENEEGILRVFIQEDLGQEGYFVSATLPFEPPDFTGTGSSSGDSTGSDSTDGDDSSTGGGTTAGGGTGDLPLLADATEVFKAGQVVAYYSATNIPGIVDFYRNELAALGWSENTASSFADDNAAVLTFQKDGATLTIAAAKESEGRVSVNLIQQ